MTLLISTLGYLTFLGGVLGIRPLLTPLVWACLITTFVYAFAIVGQLSLGANLALGLGVVLGAVTLWQKRNALPRPSLAWLTVPVYLAPFVIFYMAIPDDFVFLVWDEVGTWAKTQKLVYDTDALLNAGSPIAIKSYPPGQIIFQYYFTKVTWWSAKHVLFAQNVFMFCALIGAVGALVKKPVWAALVFLTLFPVLYFFRFDYTTIYADPLLAVVFSACVALALKPRERWLDDLVLAMCLCGFVLLKDMSIVFTTLVIAIYVVNIVGTPRAGLASKPLQRAWQAGAAVLICGLAVAVVLRSWRWYVSFIDAAKTDFTLLTLNSLTQDAFQLRLGKTVSAFVYNLLKPDYFASQVGPLGFNLSLAQLIGVLVLLSMLITLLSAAQRRAMTFLTVLGLFAGAVGYLLFLIWLYLVFFTEYEGIRLASFDRYSMTYILAWTLVLYTLLMAVLSEFKIRLLVLIPLTALLLTYALVPTKFFVDATRVQIDAQSFEKMNKAQALSNAVRKVIQPNEKVYFLAQQSNGYERHLFDYAMVPFLPSECWSVGKKYNEADVWTCDQPLGYLLKDYDYLAIYHADQRFWQDNQALFSADGAGKETGVYKVTRKNDGTTLLLPVQ